MARTATGVFLANATLDLPGTYHAFLWARDRSSHANTADTSADPLLISVVPQLGPSIQAVSPASGAVIPPGTVLAFRTGGPVAIQGVQARLNGHDVPVPPSDLVQVPTDGLPDGPLNLTLWATDALGQTTRVAFAYRLDGTPPRVLVALGTATPAVGATVSVRAVVQDASALGAVRLRLQDQDGRGTEQALSPIGNRTYEGTFAATASLRLVQVLARDAAGNEGLGEAALAPVQGTKSAPAAPAFAALALALAARRRGGR
jgi:hypothetical protein